jgi:hypothetical protein
MNTKHIDNFKGVIGMEFNRGDSVKIVNVDIIKQGDYLWSNGDIVEVRDVEEDENRIEVWNTEKTMSELIYTNEFRGIERLIK